MTQDNHDRDVLEAAYAAWSELEQLRLVRERLKRFTYGLQWDDPTRNSRGEIVSERQCAEDSGRTPLTNNMIRQLVKSVVGRFRQLQSEDTLPTALQALYDSNALHELDARALEEFLISGCAIQRIVHESRSRGEGVWVDNVAPSRFFINRLADPRGWDVEIVGMLHDMSLPETVMRFSHGSRERAKAIRHIYESEVTGAISRSAFYCAPSHRCRVIEVWTLESVESVRGSAYRTSTRWRCRHFTPSGYLLDSTYSPYPHGNHPFVVKMYPLTDGEIHPFVEDIIDQQKHINRLITTIDHIMGSSAKGVLLYPRAQKPEDMSWDEIGRQWAAPDGLLPYDPRPGEAGPQQIITNTNNLGAFQLLNLEMKLFGDISGVSEALMGRVSTGVNGQSMYETQVRNATIALGDIFDSFRTFLRERDDKMSRTIAK